MAGRGNPKGVNHRLGSHWKQTKDVRDLARLYTAEAIAALARIMRNPKHPAQATAANHLLDRGWGKPAQAITGAGGDGPVTIVVRDEWSASVTVAAVLDVAKQIVATDVEQNEIQDSETVLIPAKPLD